MVQRDRKGKPIADGHGVYETDGAYHCEECHYEVPIEQDCPKCKKHIDWNRVFMETNR